MRRFALIDHISIALLLLAGCAETSAPSTDSSQAAQADVTEADPIRWSSADSPTPKFTQRSVEDTPTTALITPTPTSSPTPSVTPTPVPWQYVARGIEARLVPINLADQPTTFYAYAMRIDPAHVEFRVHYDPEQPRPIDEWQTTTGAAIIFNGGFFAGNNTPVGRIVTDGQEYGYPLNYGEGTIGVAGVFGVIEDNVALYAIGRSSFSPRGLRFDEAVESYPMLVLPGSQPVYPTETGEQARRTVVGVDRQGRVIIMVSDVPVFTLHQLADWLASSDLGIDTALNLDGGRSSGIAVSLPGEIRLINSYVPVPIAIAAYTK